MKEKQHLSEKEKQQLRGVYKKRLLGFLMMLFFIPVGMLLSEGIESSTLAGILVFMYFIFMVFLFLKIAFYKCPRCHKPFFSSLSLANGFTSKCLNCGLSFEGK
ncbi:MAG: hypothetical protein ABIJ59_10490 [Pseudomonadota bacterium]